MKRLVAILVLFTFACSVDNVETVETLERGQPCEKVKENKMIVLEPSTTYNNDVEFFESLEVTSIPNGQISHITWDSELTNGNYFRVSVLDSNFDYILSPINLGTQQYATGLNGCESVIVKNALESGTLYYLWVQDNTSTNIEINVYVPIQL